jgi:mRNA interferase MazF
MNSSSYIPNKGDLVWLILDPRAGHGQSGRRPAIVLSHKLFTKRTGLSIICPITSKVKDLPFEIRVKTEVIDGAVLPIHVRSVDVIARKVQFIEKAPEDVLLKTSKAIDLIIG